MGKDLISEIKSWLYPITFVLGVFLLVLITRRYELSFHLLNFEQYSLLGQSLGSLFLFSAIIICYLLPAVVAQLRKHNNQLAVFMLNLFLGWTFIGWVIALVWACTDNTNKEKAA